MSSHYETLNVTRDAEDVVIDSAYRALMKRYHPDKTNGDPVAAERAKEINAAYSTLRDPESRAHYDRSLGQETPRSQPDPQPRPQPKPKPQAARPTEPTARRDPSPSARSSPRSALLSALFIGLSLLIGIGALGSLFSGGSTSAPTETTPTTTPDAGNDGETNTPRPPSARADERDQDQRQLTVDRRQEPESPAPRLADEDVSKTDTDEGTVIKEETEGPPPPKDLEGLY